MFGSRWWNAWFTNAWWFASTSTVAPGALKKPVRGSAPKRPLGWGRLETWEPAPVIRKPKPVAITISAAASKATAIMQLEAIPPVAMAGIMRAKPAGARMRAQAWESDEVWLGAAYALLRD